MAMSKKGMMALGADNGIVLPEQMTAREMAEQLDEALGPGWENRAEVEEPDFVAESIVEQANKLADMSEDAKAAAFMERRVDQSAIERRENEAERRKYWATRVDLMIAADNDPQSDPIVQVGVNGRMYAIHRGVLVKVPRFVAHALKNAVTTKYRWDQQTYKITPVIGPTYPYSCAAPH